MDKFNIHWIALPVLLCSISVTFLLHIFVLSNFSNPHASTLERANPIEAGPHHWGGKTYLACRQHHCTVCDRRLHEKEKLSWTELSSPSASWPCKMGWDMTSCLRLLLLWLCHILDSTLELRNKIKPFLPPVILDGGIRHITNMTHRFLMYFARLLI